MKKLLTVLFFVLLSFVSCDFDYTPGGDYQRVEYDLWGTWERDVAAVWPEGQTVSTEYGKLVFAYDTITITGPIAHLQGYTRNTTLEAYTEDGYLYIKDKGEWQTPISYNKWEAGGSYPRDQMLTLQGGGIADETLKQTSK